MSHTLLPGNRRTVADAADSGTLRIKASEFEQIRRLAYQEFGLDLKNGKEELVNARLGKVMRGGAFPNFRSYFEHVVADSTGDALIELIDALTTNHTSFLREPAHFRFLEAALRTEFQHTGVLRIWSAACSTGEEPYSIAFSLLNAGLPPAAFRILATDISTRALAKANRGIYPAERFDQVPDAWRHRFLLRGEGESRGWFKIKPEVAAVIEFGRLNLIEALPPATPFQFIFCRNVMMYFDRQTQAGVVNRLAAQLEPGGYLFVGHSESLSGIQHPLTFCQPAIYRKGRARNGGQSH